MNKDLSFAENEVKEAQPKKGKKSLSSFLHSTKFKKGGLATAFTVAFVVIIVLLNIVFSMLENRFPSLQLDMTEDKRFSLSEEAEEAAELVDIPTTVYVLATEEIAKGDEILSQAASLLERATQVNSNITVEYIDLERNPTFASAEKYASFSLSTGSIIFENERRIRALAPSDLYVTEYESYYTNPTYYYIVDTAVTNAFLQVTADSIPVVSIAVGSHGEMLNQDNLATFQSLLAANSFDVQYFDLLTQEIPENTTIVMLPTPTSDYTDEELAKLDAFLDDSIEGYNALWVTMHSTQPDLPKLSAFLSEWGLAAPTQVVKESDANHIVAPEASYLMSNVSEALNIGGSGEYKNFITPQSRPIDILFDANDSIATYVLTETYETAYRESASGKTTNTSDLGVQATTAIGRKMEKINGTYYDKSVVVFGSSAAFTGSYVSSTAFGNATYLVDLARFSAGISDSSMKVSTKQIETYTYDITISTAARNIIGIGLFVIAIPLALIIAGVLVYLKRRHL